MLGNKYEMQTTNDNNDTTMNNMLNMNILLDEKFGNVLNFDSFLEKILIDTACGFKLI
jgi:hypothetical protein